MEIENEIITEIDELLEPVNEMSMAFHYKDRHVEVCAWVENPTYRDNRYFKYYNSAFVSSATKVARIRIDKAEYVGGNHKERNLTKWILSNRELRELVEILQTPSDEHIGYTKWQDILITYNRDNFHLSAQDTIAGNLAKGVRSPELPSSVEPFPIDYPMPDYLNIRE